MKFVDETEIKVRSGHGGPGMVSFRSARNLPKLGADGGDGGFGGHVFLKGNSQLNTLSALYYRRLYTAGDGEKGGPNGRTGKNGDDLTIPVPVGTVARNLDTGEVLCEILEDGEEVLIAEGGKRGLGNLRYLSPRHQAPEEHTSGGPSIEIRLGLELKIIADVGLAGFPNAGKSSLLSVISAARPKVADYPFTTLEPQLGVVDMEKLTGTWGQSFVVADIPGLIEGASDGRGLGHEFLRHLERTKVICFVIDPYDLDGKDPLESLAILRNELARFGRKLERKRSMVVLTKADLRESSYESDKLVRELEAEGYEAIAISSVSHLQIKEFKYKIWQLIQEEASKIEVEEDDWSQIREKDQGYKTITHASDEDLLGFS